MTIELTAVLFISGALVGGLIVWVGCIGARVKTALDHIETLYGACTDNTDKITAIFEQHVEEMELSVPKDEDIPRYEAIEVINGRCLAWDVPVEWLKENLDALLLAYMADKDLARCDPCGKLFPASEDVGEDCSICPGCAPF